MALLPEHESHHSLAPKELGLSSEKKELMSVHVARSTNATGEQLSISVPIYGDESREELQKRLNFAYSIMQDRMEDENKAIEFKNKREQVIRLAQERIKRNEHAFKKDANAVRKDQKKLGDLIANYAESYRINRLEIRNAVWEHNNNANVTDEARAENEAEVIKERDELVQKLSLDFAKPGNKLDLAQSFESEEPLSADLSQ